MTTLIYSLSEYVNGSIEKIKISKKESVSFYIWII